MRCLALPVSLLAVVACSLARLSAAPVEVVPSAGMSISGPVRLAPGEYRWADAGPGRLRITGKRFTLDLKGVRLTGDGKGTGILIRDAESVVLKNATVSGCGWGVVLEHCTGVRLEDCDVSRNANLPPGTVIDESGKEPEDQHGGGIVLRDCRDCRVLRCTAQHQWDGVDLVRSDGNRIEEGDYSYNGNWGIHLWKSSRNVFRGNRAVWCTTGGGTLFQSLGGWQTYDAQAVAIDHASCDNLIEGNDLRFGGDGIFIRANEGGEKPGTAVPPRNSSDRNILRDNDCSFSPNNAIEVDFVAGTVIEANNCSFSNYGMWLGYSRGSRVRNNSCVNDTTRAVEIENGQDGTFEGNVFGWDAPRENGALVLLRQNGRDATPSGPYRLTDNVFYGGGKAVELVRTRGVIATRNTVLSETSQAPPRFVSDADSTLEATDNVPPPAASPPEVSSPPTLRPSAAVTIRGEHLRAGAALPVVTLNGTPLWVRKATDRAIRCWVPADFWNGPAPTTAALQVFDGRSAGKALGVPLEWPKDRPVIRSISPMSAAPGELVTVSGESLAPGGASGVRLLLNNVPVPLLDAGAERLTFRAPTGMVLPERYNLLLERRDALRARTWPIPFAVHLDRKELPHLLSAMLSPTTLRVGEMLKVEFVVRNNLPYAAPLQTRPAPPFTYREAEAWYEMGVAETRGALHLRVTSDHPGAHHPGSWPWLFGFAAGSLGPGEVATVTGFVRVETPGEHEFKVGLVAGGGPFIDDNAFRTRITVLP